jgi:hypothetical protein
MNNETIVSKLNTLPEEFKRQVLDFIEFLSDKHEKNIQKQKRKSPVFGSCKGLFVIPDDFDEPLEDFKDYM